MKVGKVALGDLARVRTGKLDANASSPNGKYPFFTCAINPLRIDTFSYECECVLVAGNGDLNVKYHNGRFDAYQRTYIVEPISQSLDCRYLYHFLDSYLTELRKLSIGGVIKYIKLGNLNDAQIPLPPLEEQRRIAAILDKAHEIQVADRKRRETLGRFQASYFRYLFGEPSKANENWSLKTISSCCKSIQTGPFGSLLHQSDYIQGGIPILNPKHIVNGVVSCGENETITRDKAEELSGYRLEEGDVLLARRGEMGRCAAITKRENGYLCGTGSMFLRLLRDTLAPEYLASLLSSENMRSKLERVAIGTTLLNLNSTIVGDVLIPVPPIELQFRYARFLARLDAIGDITSRSAFACSAVLASIQNSIFPI
jgi:type I restriction enzyme, S subunit